MTTNPEDSDRPELDKAKIDAAFTDITSRIGPLGDSANIPAPAPDDDDEVEFDPFVPEEPPPIPRPQDTLARFAWAGVLAGPLFALAVYLFGLPRWMATAASVAFVAGFVVLIWRKVDERDEYDDGARL